jgi:heavy metal sensor kinase
MERDRQFSNITVEMISHVGTIMDLMRFPPPPRPHEPGEPPPQRPFPPDHPPGGLHLPPRDDSLLSARFDATGTNGFYYVIWTWDGTRELMRSTNAPPDLPTPIGHEWTRMRGIYREDFMRVPAQMLPGPLAGYMILVGRSIAPELHELHRGLVTLVSQAAIMWFMGLLIGWKIAARAIRPIETISSTAAKISAGDLSQRINVAETESELGRLAAVLNSTFGRLETAFAQQRQFTADAAHELRTPVSVMLTQTQTALNRERSTAEYRETLEACQRASQRMRKLIESLLELARLDAGQETLKRLRFDLSQVANDCVELVRPLAGERGVKILSELLPLEITGDSERLAQVAANLLTNAIQYNKPGGEVHLKLESQPGLAVLTIADTGQGISNENLPHVFERFYRGDKSRTTSNGNAGLGLAISKAIVEAHGGTISVSSQPGTGTTFTVILPLI